MSEARKKNHPRVVLLEESDADSIDAAFADVRNDELDADLRHRLISERAYALYRERGYVDGYDLDDWLEAEAEIDHLSLRASEAA
jgi:hypothetical protein